MVDELIAQAEKALEGERESVQRRAKPDPRIDYGMDAAIADNFLTIRIMPYVDGAPAYTYFPARRDRFLRDFYKRESIMSGAVYGMQSWSKSLEWNLISDNPRKKAYAQDLLNEAEFGDGLPELVSKVATDLWTQDNGAFIELWGAGRPDRELAGPVRGLAHLDAGQCYRTFDRTYPVVYLDPITQEFRKIHTTRIIRMSNLTQPAETARGVGFSAVSRALMAANYVRHVLQYKDEKVTGNNKRAIIYGQGFAAAQIKSQLKQSDAEDAAEGLLYFHKVPILLPPGTGQIETKLGMLDLAGLADGFDFESELNLYVYILAVCFGVDARDIWPATQTGATKGDATVQNMKARGKGKGDLVSTIQRRLNWRVVPNGVTLEYDFTDDDADEQHATINSTKSTTIISFKTAGIITVREARAQAVAQGCLLPEALFEEELVTDAAEPASDTSDDTGEENQEGKPGAEGEQGGSQQPPPNASGARFFRAGKGYSGNPARLRDERGERIRGRAIRRLEQSGIPT